MDDNEPTIEGIIEERVAEALGAGASPEEADILRRDIREELAAMGGGK